MQCYRAGRSFSAVSPQGAEPRSKQCVLLLSHSWWSLSSCTHHPEQGWSQREEMSCRRAVTSPVADTCIEDLRHPFVPVFHKVRTSSSHKVCRGVLGTCTHCFSVTVKVGHCPDCAPYSQIWTYWKAKPSIQEGLSQDTSHSLHQQWITEVNCFPSCYQLLPPVRI